MTILTKNEGVLKPEHVEYKPIHIFTVDKKKSRQVEDESELLKYVFLFLGILAFAVTVGGVYEITSRFDDHPIIKKYEPMFTEFMMKYNRHYENEDEYEYRLSVFVTNVKEFEEYEKKHPGVDLDVTEFADRTDFELRKLLHSTVSVPEFETGRFNEKLFDNGESRPASIDWRDQGKLTPVKNQAQCGSCWAFATVGAVEAQHAIKKGELVSLSEQEMVDCDHRNNGCHGGYRPYAMNFVRKNGLERETSYPYTGIETNQCRLHENLTRVFIDDYKMLSQNEEEIADWVATKGPVTFGMNVVKEMYSYRSGVFNPTAQDCSERSMGSHALVIVGYGTEGQQPYWIVKNSWGSSWGAGGYFRLARGVNSCGVANTVVAPIIN